MHSRSTRAAGPRDRSRDRRVPNGHTSDPRAARLLRLQRTAGNRAVRTMVARDPGDPDEFAVEFNREFRTVRHAFISSCEEGEAVCSPQAGPGNDPEWLSPVLLQRLFTDEQRDKLLTFIRTKQIPERLFNGDEIGQATAQQRILVSAHILATGTYRPGSFEQRVHARMCWHWVQIVHHYAGATPASGPIASGVMGGFDVAGGAVLGAGRVAPGGFRGERALASELPDTETPGGLGPIDEQTSHGEGAATERERMEADPSVAPRFHRRSAFPMTRFNELQAGDWLWYYNANRSAGGSHSVIFSRWTSEVEESNGVAYRTAAAFSQGRPERGGREHTVKLGEQYSRTERIFPITNISRVTPESRPATTPSELLPGIPDEGADLSRQNQRFLRAKARRLGNEIDLGLLRGWLREQNQGAIRTLSGRLTSHQRSLLERTNAHDEIETLVALNQRLRVLVTNAELLQRNMTSTYEGRLNARHAQVKAEVDAAMAEIAAEFRRIDGELAAHEGSRVAHETARTSLDLRPEIRRLRREVRGLRRQIGRLGHGQSAERAELRERRRELLDEIRELNRLLQARRRGELREIRNELRRLRGLTRRLTRQRQRLGERESQVQGQLPYGLVAPGRLGSQDRRSRWRGQLRHLRPQPTWSELVVRTRTEDP